MVFSQNMADWEIPVPNIFLTGLGGPTTHAILVPKGTFYFFPVRSVRPILEIAFDSLRVLMILGQVLKSAAYLGSLTRDWVSSGLVRPNRQRRHLCIWDFDLECKNSDWHTGNWNLYVLIEIYMFWVMTNYTTLWLLRTPSQTWTVKSRKLSPSDLTGTTSRLAELESHPGSVCLD